MDSFLPIDPLKPVRQQIIDKQCKETNYQQMQDYTTLILLLSKFIFVAIFHEIKKIGIDITNDNSTCWFKWYNLPFVAVLLH